MTLLSYRSFSKNNADQPSSVMNQRVTFQQEVRTPDGLGGAEVAYEDVVSVWAQVSSLGVSETEEESTTRARHILQVRIRFREDITPAMAVLWRGTRYAISGMRDTDGTRSLLDILIRDGGSL